MDTDDGTIEKRVAGGDSSVPFDDEFMEEEGVVDARAKVATLRAKLASCEERAREHLAGWQRAKADFVNARRGEEQERAEFLRYSKESVLLDVLTLADSFELAFADKTRWESVDKSWRSGVECIYAQLQSLLGRYKVVGVGLVGDRFNPALHTPVAITPTDLIEKDQTITTIVRRGYEFDGKLIRPAQVEIAEFNQTHNI